MTQDLVAAVLWDADGVLQRLPSADEFDEMWPFLSSDERDALLNDIFGGHDQAILTGGLDMSTHVDAIIVRHDLGHHRDSVRELWSHFPAVPEARALLAEVRRTGTTSVLATNQDSLREQNMRPVYAPLLDRLYFSSAMGVAKPDAAFFAHIGHALGLAPGELLLVDDRAENVEGAQRAGLKAVLWHFDRGIDVLRKALADHGVGVC